MGTPHINNVVYFLTAKVLGIEFKTSDLTMSYQKVIYNGFEFKFNCFDNESLRMIQFSYIESDLIQAVGRARTLRTDAKVDLIFKLPFDNKFKVYVLIKIINCLTYFIFYDIYRETQL